ncbi:MAG: hypothetical protein Q8O24_01520 [Gallionellaceae bacterium]|nr:hypothetical protein [Gallionellaceae bacterium]
MQKIRLTHKLSSSVSSVARLKRNHSLFLASLLAICCADSALAVSIARPEANKLGPTGSTVKEFVERTSHEFNLYVAHSCAYIPYGMATTGLLAILPSAKLDQFEFLTSSVVDGKTVFAVDPNIKIEDVFYTAYTDPNDPTKKIEATSGPLNNLRLSTNAVFKKTESFWQKVSPFSHHGRAQDDTVSGAYWSDGKLSDEFYTDLKFRATAATLRGCVASVKVYVPVWQVCGKTDYTSYSVHPDALGANDFAPNFTIIRNEITNPYPEECKTDTTKRLNLTVTPSNELINMYLKQTKLPGKRMSHSFTHG